MLQDVTPGEDRLPLAFEADAAAPGVQDFVLVAGPFAANQPGTLRLHAITADGVHLHGNTDAAAQAESVLDIRGPGAGALGLADLIL